MRTRIVLSLVAVVALAPSMRADQIPTATPESVGLSSQRLERLATAIQDEIARGRMPGAVVAIARRGRLAYYEAFGALDAAAKTPMPKDAIFALASMTKPLVAAGTLMLAEEGRLLLNDPVGNYLPALANRQVQTASGLEPARRQPTLQDMLRHTAGVSYGNRGNSPLHALYGLRIKSAATQTSDDFLKELGALPLFFQPGSAWEYSYGLDVAGLAIEAVTKQRLGAFLHERLFAPLGMVDTAFVQPEAKAARIARPLAKDPDTGQPITFRPATVASKYDCGGGCASGTALDYLRFALMLLDKGTLDGHRVLGRKSVEYMTANQLGAGVDVSRLHEFAVEHMDGFGFGLGVAVRTEPGIAGVPGTPGEFLWSGAQGTMFWVDPKEELAVVYLASTPGPIRRHYRELVKLLVVQAIAD
ncbi:MAG: serine hydrolase domain-containing protein [Vicinamibacterales bacterium]